jgi:hypothetical protein
VPAGEETDVRMHAELGLDIWTHVRRPPKTGWIHGPLHAPVGRSDRVDLGAADLAVVGAFDWIEERVHGG